MELTDLSMTDYSELVKAFRCKSLSKECDSCGYGYRLCPDSECNDACDVEKIYADAAAIEELQAQLPKRGEWIHVDGDEPWEWRCTACHKIAEGLGKFRFCPNCGAKMEVQE